MRLSVKESEGRIITLETMLLVSRIALWFMSEIQRVMPSNVESLVLFVLSYSSRCDVIVHRNALSRQFHNPMDVLRTCFRAGCVALSGLRLLCYLQNGQDVMLAVIGCASSAWGLEPRKRGGVVTGVRGRRTRMGATRRSPQLVAFSNVASWLP